MKSIFAILILATGLGFGEAARADFQDGMDAYDRGDYATAVQEWRPLAEQGHAKAQFNLGDMYSNGRAALQHDKEAEKWYRKAAEQGQAGAQFCLGESYDTGRGVLQDGKEAAKCYGRAAEQGYDRAKSRHCFSSDTGRGVPKADEIVEFYRKLAEQGAAFAQYNLGVAYDTGRGVRQDTKRAHMWLNIGVLNGEFLAHRHRRAIVERMTSTEINQAQDMARRCMESGYKDC